VRLVVGRVRRAHGIQGEVRVEVRTDDPDRRFAPGVVLHTDPAEAGPLTVTSSRQHAGMLLVRFTGFSDRTLADRLRGTLLLTDVDEAEASDDADEFYDHQLIGLRAVTTAERSIGEVTDVLHLPGQDVLVITRQDGVEVLVPFVAALVPSVDLTAGMVTVEPRPGLLDPETIADGPDDAAARFRAQG
jgi:16S rRNA processing protein RimM